MNKYQHSIHDILISLKNIAVCFYIAFSDTRAKYKRSLIGPLWLTMGLLISVVGLGLVWSKILNLDLKIFLPNLAFGLTIWFFFSSILIESPGLYQRNSSIIKNINRPLFFLNLNLVLKNTIIFLHNIILVLIISLYFGYTYALDDLFYFIYLLICLVNLTFFSLFLAILGARFKDIEVLITSFLPILFFISPVIFNKSHLSSESIFFKVNIFNYYLEILKSPLVDIEYEYFMSSGIYYFILLTLFLIFISMFFFVRYKHRIVFWI